MQDFDIDAATSIVRDWMAEPRAKRDETVEVPLTRAELDTLVSILVQYDVRDARPEVHNAVRMLKAAQSLDDLRTLKAGAVKPQRRATDGLRQFASITDALAARQHDPRTGTDGTAALRNGSSVQ